MASTLTTIWTSLVFLLALAETRHVWRRFSAGSLIPRWLLAGLPLSAAIAATVMWIRVVRSPFDDWNGARTAQAVAWGMGLPLYYEKGVGPATDFIYGPVAAIVRLPAALAATPTVAIILAAAINLALMFIPAVCLIRAVQPARLSQAVALLVFAGFTLNIPSLIYSTYNVHADAPAVGFAMLSCAAILRAGDTPRKSLWMAATAMFACLSIFSKQNMLAILAVLPIYAGWRYRWRDAGILLLLLGGFGLIGAAISFVAFGRGPIVYSMFTASLRPGRWPRYDWPGSLFMASGFLIQDVILPAASLGMLLVCRFMNRQHAPGALLREGWILPLAIAISLVPSSLLGYARIGGEINSFTLVTIFVVAALAVCVSRVSPAPDRPVDSASASACVLAAIVLCVMSAAPWSTTIRLRDEISNLKNNPQQTAFEFAKAHPNRAYFPWHPLPTLMVDHRYYHFEYGIVGLRLSGEIMDAARIYANAPPDMQYLIYLTQPQSDDLRRVFPAYSKIVRMPGMDDWIIRTRED